ncbi:hypothetical protein HEP87_61860 [Streptomyces sp. S1D4-11]|nr:hypothetical protein [Streptomyces sp. S1D4-11]
MATPSRHHIWQEEPSMNLTLKRLLGVTAAVTMGAAALLGPGKPPWRREPRAL